MKQIRIKILPGVGSADGSWEIVGFDDFLTRYSPGLRMHVTCAKQFPPIHIINEELLSGGNDQGMSGGCFWKPFSLSLEEYNEIAEEMLTSPKYALEYDPRLEGIENLNKWCGAVVAQHNPKKKGSRT